MINLTPMSRERAQILGLEKYVPLKKCRMGHLFLMDTFTGRCLECALFRGQKVGKHVPQRVNRERALFLGLETFLPKTKCAQGHRTARDTATGECLECKKARTKAGK